MRDPSSSDISKVTLSGGSWHGLEVEVNRLQPSIYMPVRVTAEEHAELVKLLATDNPNIFWKWPQELYEKTISWEYGKQVESWNYKELISYHPSAYSESPK